MADRPGRPRQPAHGEGHEASPSHTAETPSRAFYARRDGRWADWWTLLHPPYTGWHLSYVVLGAAVAPRTDWVALTASVVAFLLAVGVAAHALDELAGRPLRTRISDRALKASAVLGLLGATALGITGIVLRDLWLLAPLVPVGLILAIGYNLEVLGARLHTDLGFALSWGGFPVVVGFVAQQPPADLAVLVAALLATAMGVSTALAQRTLSTPARRLRRRTRAVEGVCTDVDGGTRPLDRSALLQPLERALRLLSWSMPLLAAAFLLAT